MKVAERARGLFRSPAVQRALGEARAAIAEPGCVLIAGEPGTGRATLARAIHLAINGNSTSLEELLCSRTTAFDSPAPFFVADCRTTRDVETLLFGSPASSNSHDGPESVSANCFLNRTRHGTLFLPAVQDIPRRVQNRLARVLRDGEVWLDDGRSSRVVAVRSRVIASVDVAPPGEDDLLAPELKKRLAAHQIELPPLRQRREDVPGLVRLLVAEICMLQRAPLKGVSPQAISLLSALPWRGNLTELTALLKTLVANVPGRMIRVPDVLNHVRLDEGNVTLSKIGTLKEARELFERDYVAAVLKQQQGRMAQAARVLGMQRQNLYRKVRQLAVARKTALPRNPPYAAGKPHDRELLVEATLPGTHRRTRHSVHVDEDSMEVR